MNFTDSAKALIREQYADKPAVRDRVLVYMDEHNVEGEVIGAALNVALGAIPEVNLETIVDELRVSRRTKALQEQNPRVTAEAARGLALREEALFGTTSTAESYHGDLGTTAIGASYHGQSDVDIETARKAAIPVAERPEPVMAESYHGLSRVERGA